MKLAIIKHDIPGRQSLILDGVYGQVDQQGRFTIDPTMRPISALLDVSGPLTFSDKDLICVEASEADIQNLKLQLAAMMTRRWNSLYQDLIDKVVAAASMRNGIIPGMDQLAAAGVDAAPSAVQALLQNERDRARAGIEAIMNQNKDYLVEMRGFSLPVEVEDVQFIPPDRFSAAQAVMRSGPGGAFIKEGTPQLAAEAQITPLQEQSNADNSRELVQPGTFVIEFDAHMRVSANSPQEARDNARNLLRLASETPGLGDLLKDGLQMTTQPTPEDAFTLDAYSTHLRQSANTDNAPCFLVDAQAMYHGPALEQAQARQQIAAPQAEGAVEGTVAAEPEQDSASQFMNRVRSAFR